MISTGLLPLSAFGFIASVVWVLLAFLAFIFLLRMALAYRDSYRPETTAPERETEADEILVTPLSRSSWHTHERRFNSPSCDACQQPPRLRFEHAAFGVFEFCGHHGNRHRASLESKGFSVTFDADRATPDDLSIS